MFKDPDNRPHLVPLSQALVPWGPGGLVLKKLVGILTCNKVKDTHSILTSCIFFQKNISENFFYNVYFCCRGRHLPQTQPPLSPFVHRGPIVVLDLRDHPGGR